jgi:Fe-S cluster assembly scaffold protein SufB
MAAAAPKFEEWLPSERVEGLSRALSDPPGYSRIRREAYERFRELPIEPNPLFRGYGYFTNVDLAGIDPEVRGDAAALPPALPGAIRVVHDASGTRLSLPPELAAAGVRLTDLRAAWSEGDASAAPFVRGLELPGDRLTALAVALVNRGYRLEVPDRYRAPIRLQEFTILSAPHEAISVRRSIRAGDESQLFLTEEIYTAGPVPDGQRLYASSSDLDLGAGSKTLVLTVHAPDLSTVSVYRRAAAVGPAARIGWIWNGLGGFRTKLRNQTHLVGNGSSVDDLQTFYGAKSQSYDSSVDITHVGTDTHGQSITRGVFSDQSRGMSRGLVRIEAGARKTIAYVSEHAMLLSRGARSDTIPILEILCRDVKATHSTSVAPVDPEKVFYLESRGMTEAEAIRAIGEGFLSYVLERAPVDHLREILYAKIRDRWDGKEIPWTADAASPALPALAVTGSELAPEWRFDAKLR